MSFDWNAQLASLSALSGPPTTASGGVITSFGDPERELESARTSTVIAPLGHLALIACSGPDAASFLHNQLTSDINHLADQRAQHSAWCTAKGRMIASFLVVRSADTLLLQLDDELAETVAKKLKMFILRSKVTIADVSADRALIGLAGPRAGETLVAAGFTLPDAPLSATTAAAGIAVRLDDDRFELLLDRSALAATWARLAAIATPVGVAAWQWLDIQAGLPTITAATREEFVPQMANFEQIGGVSFHKGCYPGQEVIARTQYLGKVKRHLYRVAASVPMAPGMPIFSSAAQDQACGQVVNSSPAPGGGSIALAVLQESAAAGEMRLRAPDGPLLTAAAAVAPSSTGAN